MLTFDQFYNTREEMTVSAGAEYLRVDSDYFEGDSSIIVFEDYCFITRRGNLYHTIICRDEYENADESYVASHLYFDHYVWEQENTADDLTVFYGEWLKWQGLEESCALELLMGADLTPYQRRWLEWFCDVWDRVTA